MSPITVNLHFKLYTWLYTVRHVKLVCKESFVDAFILHAYYLHHMCP